MGYGPRGKVFSQQITSGATSAATPINLNHAWDRVYLEIPTFASGGTHYIQGCATSDGTFRRLYTIDPADGGNNVWQVLTSQCIVPVPPGFQYYKVENTTGVTNTIITYYFHVS